MKPKYQKSRLVSHLFTVCFVFATSGLSQTASAATTSNWTYSTLSPTVNTTASSADLVMSAGTYVVGQLITLPAVGGITAGSYFITSVSSLTIQVSTTPGGTAVTATSTTSGTSVPGYKFDWSDATKWSAGTPNTNGILADFGNVATGFTGVSVSGSKTLYGLTYSGGGNGDLGIDGGANGTTPGTLNFATDDASVPVITMNGAGNSRLVSFGGTKQINISGNQGIAFRSSIGTVTGTGLTATASLPSKQIRLTNVAWTGFSGGVTLDRSTVQIQNNDQLPTTQDLTVGGAFSIANSVLAEFSLGTKNQTVGNLNGNVWGRIRSGGTLTVGNGNATGGDFGGIIGQAMDGSLIAANFTKTGTGTQTISGLIKGTSAVNANGGILNLNSSNPYVGVTTVNTGGTLVLGANDALGSGGISPINQGRGNVLVKTGAVLDLHGKTVTEQIDLQGGTLKASATGAGANNGLAGISFNTAGSGLTFGSAVLISGGGGTGAAATAYFGPSTGLATTTGSLTIDAAGSGYTTAPTVVFTGGGGLGMAATATVSGGLVTDVNITNSGFGYTSLPTISFTGGGGTGATATLVSTKCALTGIQVTNPGSDYTTAPVVSISGDGSEIQPTISDRATGSVFLSQNSALQDDVNLTLVAVAATTSNKTLTKLGAGTLTLAGTGDNAFIALDAQAGTVLLDKEIAGRAANVLTLNGANTTLPATGANNKQVNTLIVNSGTFDLNGQGSLKSTVTAFSGTGGFITNNGAAASTLYIGDGGGVYSDVLTYSGVIKNGAVNKTSVAVQGNSSSTREVIFDGANTYTGSTTVTAGKLTLKSTYLGNSSSVVIGASGVLNLDYVGTDTVGALSLGGTAQLDGVYGAMGSGAANETALITGTGRLHVITPAGYTTWATTNAGGQTANLDFDNDGIRNGAEYFMNSAAGFTANPGVVSGKVTWPNGGNISSAAYGTEFVVQTSSTLSSWTNVSSGDSHLSNTSGSLQYTLPTGAGKLFIRLVVTPN